MGGDETRSTSKFALGMEMGSGSFVQMRNARASNYFPKRVHKGVYEASFGPKRRNRLDSRGTVFGQRLFSNARINTFRMETPLGSALQQSAGSTRMASLSRRTVSRPE